MNPSRTFGAFGALLLAFSLVAGCDRSKAELESTKEELRRMTSHRDELKSQLSHADNRIATLERQVAELQAAPKPAPTIARPAGGPSKAPNKAKASRSKAARKR